MKCKCCNSSNIQNIASKNGYSILSCKRCHTIYADPSPTEAELNRFYATQNRSMSIAEILKKEVAYPNSTLDAKRILQMVLDYKQGGSLLDVGAGFGFFSKEFSPHFSLDAIEINEECAHCYKGINGFAPQSLSFEKYNPSKTYDVILMSQVLEHAIDPVQWIQKSHGLLNESGLLIIAVPNYNHFIRQLFGIQRDFYICPPEHLNFFTEKSLSYLLLEQGFELKKTITVNRFPLDFLNNKLHFEGQSLMKHAINPVLSLLDLIKAGLMINVVAQKTTV